MVAASLLDESPEVIRTAAAILVLLTLGSFSRCAQAAIILTASSDDRLLAAPEEPGSKPSAGATQGRSAPERSCPTPTADHSQAPGSGMGGPIPSSSASGSPVAAVASRLEFLPPRLVARVASREMLELPAPLLPGLLRPPRLGA
jgi:hypothetical protein